MPALSAAAAFSFLKETRGSLKWTFDDLVASLKISAADAKQVLALLQFEGYIKPTSGPSEFLTTPGGETVSGSKPPRYARESVESALTSLSERIQALKQDSKAPYKVSKAVAFGDFLSDRQRLQAPEVGILLLPRKPRSEQEVSATERAAQRAFLRKLRGKTQLLNMQPYQDWMSARSHRRLLE